MLKNNVFNSNMAAIKCRLGVSILLNFTLFPRFIITWLQLNVDLNKTLRCLDNRLGLANYFLLLL